MSSDRVADATGASAILASMDEMVATLSEETADGWPTTTEREPRRRAKQTTAAVPDNAGGAAPDPWGQATPDDDPVESARTKGPAALCALVMLRAALVDAPGFMDRAMTPGVVSVIHAPGKEWGLSIGRAWLSVVGVIYDRMYPTTDPIGTAGSASRTPTSQLPSWARGQQKGASHFSVFERPPPRAVSMEMIQESLDDGRPIHVVTHDPAILDPDIRLVEEQRLVVPPLHGRLLAQCAEALDPSGPWPPPGRIGISPLLAEAAPELLLFHLNAAWRADQDAAAYIGRLAELAARRTTLAAADGVRSLPTLDTLPGLGEAGEWGRRAVADLKAYARGDLPWSEVDRGIVLEGPPGTGKSTFARALAGSAGVPLVVSSLAQWQGHRDGHLGTLLNAMQSTFAQARKQAPCILLVDEIDSFPTRSTVTHRHKDYVIEVINGLLEQLDGAVDRTGVLVVATCNDAADLDPALTRPGRLERIVRVNRPDADGVEGILRVHLGDALRGEDLRPLAMAAVTRKAVGADVEAWCRGARRRARTAGRLMLVADLEAEIGPPPQCHTPVAIRRMAVHEAGHSLAFVRMGAGVLQEVVVDPVVGSASSTAVDTTELHRDAPHATRRQAMMHISAALSGRAAEEVVLGDPSGGAGGTERSDLARATTLACMIAASSGLDDHPEALIYLSAAEDHRRRAQLLLLPEFRQRVNDILRQAYDDALSTAREYRTVIEEIADLLVERGSLSGPEVEALVAKSSPAGRA